MIHGFWDEFNGGDAIVGSIGRKGQGLKTFRVLVIALTIISAGVVSAKTGAKQPLIDVQKPSIVAFYPPVSESEAENQDEIESLGDFRLFVEESRKPLKAEGIELHEVFSTSFRIRVGVKTTSFHSAEAGVGYYLIAPGKQPRVEYGVMTAEDLLQVARQYFGSTKLRN
jgi:hypothetical protein